MDPASAETVTLSFGAHMDEYMHGILQCALSRPAEPHRRPLDLLHEGKAAEVINHAKTYAADNAW